jgi:hypothetical protein
VKAENGGKSWEKLGGEAACLYVCLQSFAACRQGAYLLQGVGRLSTVFNQQEAKPNNYICSSIEHAEVIIIPIQHHIKSIPHLNELFYRVSPQPSVLSLLGTALANSGV